MSKFNDAAITIRKAAAKYEQMVALAAVLDEIGSLDQLAKENKAAADAAKADAAKAKDEAKKAKDKLDEVVKKAIAVESAGAEAAAAVVRSAEEKAAEIERVAQEKAAAMITAAQMEVSAISSGNEMAIANVRAEVNDSRVIVTNLRKDIDARTAELAAIEKALAKAKEKIAALIA